MSSAPAQKLTVPGAIGMAAGGLVGAYAGLSLLLPLSGAAAAWWVSRKVLPEPSHSVIPALAVQTGHALWITLGLIIIGTLDANALDPVILLVGIAWLAARPSNGPVYFLAVFQIIGLGINASAFVDATVGTAIHKALLVHVLLRALSLFLLGQLWFRLRKISRTENGDL